jgi:hypothetical protein
METFHCMPETEAAFRLVVIRRPYQGNLFDAKDSVINIWRLRRIDKDLQRLQG